MNGTARRVAAARNHERFRITSYLQLFREADLLPPSRDVASTALILLFREEVFSSHHAAEGRRSQTAATTPARMRWRQANILASGFRVREQPDASSFPPSPPRILDDWPWEIVSSHSSATAPESHGNSSHCSTPKTDKEPRSEVAGGVPRLKIYFAP